MWISILMLYMAKHIKTNIKNIYFSCHSSVCVLRFEDVSAPSLYGSDTDWWPLFLPVCVVSGVLFLQYGEETKQVWVPREISSQDALRALFVTAFPQQLTMKMLQSPNMAIYIKDTTRNVYYDLEDIRWGWYWEWYAQWHSCAHKFTYPVRICDFFGPFFCFREYEC